ncbi:MAG: RecQ family ATP-dependent DNA helicase, partial [Burkholderiales bacterium]|nr:RecQ family ATP-dependent DNA helicase [Burkholderiales bacterium]
MPDAPLPPESAAFAPRCLSLDLEVGLKDSRIRRFAAVRGDSGRALVFQGGDLDAALRALEAFAEGAAFLLGHNLVAFDRPQLAAVRPASPLLALPAVDTLRLSPLAFPRHPYHHLVKHYQDARLQGGRRNDPELDARLALEAFRDQHRALQAASEASPEQVAAFHWLATREPGSQGLNAFFSTLRRRPCPTGGEARAALARCLAGRGCRAREREILAAVDDADANLQPWPLAYALAWLSVCGGSSVMPPWVRYQFPEAGRLVRRLRDAPCGDPACAWCRERHDARKELARWFGFADFRPEPRCPDGRPMQQAIVEAAMRGEHLLGILPTGAGKSVCYQVPALSRYDKTGALAVVISPLVALMADQVAGLVARGISSAAAINGLLSMPERADALERVRLGDVAILLLAPEQLRSRAVRQALAQREIGAWVVDEAHCISKWGHDFRPDYRYVARFIAERAGDGPVPPLLFLTATAKPDVVADIRAHVAEKLGVDLRVHDGGATRENLDYAVLAIERGRRLAHVHEVIESDLPAGRDGGAIVYCATRRGAEETALFLRDKQLSAEYFHAGLPPEAKKSVQERFLRGEVRVIAATNAFGMGIDKPDVRLVVHADVPGSLENYLQEAGRAGRDRAAARCVLLYAPEDLEWQFGLSARARLSQREIQAVLHALRRLDRGKRMAGEVVATAGEILREEDEGVFQRDSATDDTRVRTALAWLEEAALLAREENRVQLFPSSLRVNSVQEARAKLARRPMDEAYRRGLLALARSLIEAHADEGISTDLLMAASGLAPERLRRALYDLEDLGIASNDTALSAFVHAGVERSSQRRLAQSTALESALIAAMREAAPELEKGQATVLHLRLAAQSL